MTIVGELPAVGLTMAFTSALGNVLGEVLRKRLTGSFNPGTVTFAYRLPTALFIGVYRYDADTKQARSSAPNPGSGPLV